MKQNNGNDIQPPLTRKEVASLLNFRTPDQVRSNESNLGLLDCKVTLNKNVVLYNKAKAMKALRARGLI